MSTKLLGKISPVANTYITLYSAPTDKKTVALLNICNTNSSSVKIRFAICPSTYVEGSDPQPEDFYEYNTGIPSGNALERTAIIIDNGEKIVVYADTLKVAFRLHGMEE
jgi:hypothetical protein